MRGTQAQVLCLAEAAMGFLALSCKTRKNSKQMLLRLLGSTTSQYVATLCIHNGWIEFSDTIKVYYEGRVTAHPAMLTGAGKMILRQGPMPLPLLVNEELTVRMAASVLSVGRSRVAQILMDGLLQATKRGNRGYIKTNDLYVVWNAKRWSKIKFKKYLKKREI